MTRRLRLVLHAPRFLFGDEASSSDVGELDQTTIWLTTRHRPFPDATNLSVETAKTYLHV